MLIALPLRVLYGSGDKQQLFSLYIINRLVFVTEVEGAYSAVRTGSLYITKTRFVFEGFKRIIFL
jgi:hypothetical protein